MFPEQATQCYPATGRSDPVREQAVVTPPQVGYSTPHLEEVTESADASVRELYKEELDHRLALSGTLRYISQRMCLLDRLVF